MYAGVYYGQTPYAGLGLIGDDQANDTSVVTTPVMLGQSETTGTLQATREYTSTPDYSDLLPTVYLEDHDTSVIISQEEL